MNIGLATPATAPIFTPTTSQTECVSCASTPFNEFRQSAAYKTQTGTSTTLSWNLADLSTMTDNGIQIAVNIKSSGIILPVELVNFSATLRSGEVRLDWQTANEINSKGFYIERLKGADTWTTFGFVPSQGKGSDYQFIDEHPLHINYYRLRQIDNDGKETFSKTITVENIKILRGAIKIFPNPTNGLLTIDDGGLTLDNITVTNAFGRQVLILNQQTAQVDLSGLPMGMYVVSIQSGKTIVMQRIIKQQ